MNKDKDRTRPPAGKKVFLFSCFMHNVNYFSVRWTSMSNEFRKGKPNFPRRLVSGCSYFKSKKGDGDFFPVKH